VDEAKRNDCIAWLRNSAEKEDEIEEAKGAMRRAFYAIRDARTRVLKKEARRLYERLKNRHYDLATSYHTTAVSNHRTLARVLFKVLNGQPVVKKNKITGFIVSAREIEPLVDALKKDDE